MATHDGRAGWAGMAADYDRTRALPGGGEEAVPRWLAARVASLGVGRLLEVGVGTGRIALPLARAGIRVVGLDRSPEMLARLVAKRADAPLPVVLGDATALPFRRRFDAVLFSHFLHLVPDLGAFGDELRRVLVPGAHVLVLDTGFEPLPSERRVVERVLPLLGERYEEWPSGVRSRDSERFDALVERLGGTASPPELIGRWPQSPTLREHLEHVRNRAWWTLRRHTAEAAARAADAAAAAFVAEGVDLDAPVEETVGARLLLGRVA